MTAESGAYRPTRKDAFVIAVANWWLRTFLSIKALVVLDTIYRDGLRLRTAPDLPPEEYAGLFDYSDDNPSASGDLGASS